MKPRSRQWDGSDPRRLAVELRAAVPAPARIAAEVGDLIEQVRSGGDEKLRELGERLDGVRVERLEVDAGERAAAAGRVGGSLRSALELAATNIRTVAEAQAGAEAAEVELPQGHRVALSEVAVKAAGIYVPGGRAPYPSTVLMGVIAARSAGVERVVVASPPGPEGVPDDAICAACEIAGADQLLAVGGAQAIAALAYGTGTIESVDVIAGPGGPWVQEAKLAVSRVVGIDGYAGPSELVVLADGSVRSDWLALDLAAQAEHGDDGLLVVVGTDAGQLQSLGAELERIGAREPSVSDAPVSLILAPGIEPAFELAEALAPEHLQLSCADAEALATRVRTAGCVFTGPLGATAFGDYAAGSNHVLPTGGAGRFTGPLGPGTFRRRISVVGMSPGSVGELSEVVAEVAGAEGFVVHGASARARAAEPDNPTRSTSSEEAS